MAQSTQNVNQDGRRRGMGVFELSQLEMAGVSEAEIDAIVAHVDSPRGMEGFWCALEEAAVRHQVLTTGNISGNRLA